MSKVSKLTPENFEKSLIISTKRGQLLVAIKVGVIP